MMNWRKAFSEVGKQFLNIAVAGLVFAFIQPFVHEELKFNMTLFSAIWYITFTVVGFLLIALGEVQNGRKP